MGECKHWAQPACKRRITTGSFCFLPLHPSTPTYPDPPPHPHEPVCQSIRGSLRRSPDEEVTGGVKSRGPNPRVRTLPRAPQCPNRAPARVSRQSRRRFRSAGPRARSPLTATLSRAEPYRWRSSRRSKLKSAQKRVRAVRTLHAPRTTHTRARPRPEPSTSTTRCFCPTRTPEALDSEGVRSLAHSLTRSAPKLTPFRSARLSLSLSHSPLPLHPFVGLRPASPPSARRWDVVADVVRAAGREGAQGATT